MSSSTPSDPLGRTAAIAVRLALVTLLAAASALLLASLFLPGALAADELLATVQDEVLDIPPLGEADTPPQNSFIYAADGSELAELNFEENRVPVDRDEIPDMVIDAVLATEDATFYEHNGVNHAAIVRAALTNFRAGRIESGASTITQQYVKMTFLTPEQTLGRKLEEAVYALRLEDDLDKDEILERYLNRSYFGRGTYGIGTAAERYFSKQIDELELGEAATLAGLLRAPEANNPINSLENAQQRRDIVLTQMAQHGFVSQDQAQAAIDQDLETDIAEAPVPEQPFWTRWISQLLVNENAAGSLDPNFDKRANAPLSVHTMLGDTREERSRTVHQGGLRIHTTLDPELQDEAEAAIDRVLTYEDEPREEIAREPLGSIVSIEPGTGAIRAMGYGPREFGDCAEDDSWVDVASDGQLLCDRTQVNPAVPGGGGSGRQPGSAIKPLIDTAAIEDGVSPGLVLDARGPKEIEGCPDDGGTWEVRNSGGNDVLNMYEAVKRSSNVYHALLIADIGPERAAEMVQRLSGYPVAEADQVCSLALGSNSTTPLAMASAYATLANRGERCAPFPIERIEDPNGEVLWEYEPTCEQVVEQDVADRVVDMLAGPVSAGGTAPGANLGEWPTRGKTGSTNDNRDAWFVGFIKQLSTAAWIGYANDSRLYESETAAAEACGSQASGARCPATITTMTDVTVGGEYYSTIFGGTLPAPMWHDYMSNIVDRYEPEGFTDPGPIPSGTVPDLLEADDEDEAEEIAEAAGFGLELEEVDHWRPAGTFVEQSPDAGDEAPLGTLLTLGVSNGSGDLPEMPDLSGLTLDEAVDELAEYDVENLFWIETETDDEDLVDRVVNTDPSQGSPFDPLEDDITLGIGVLAPEDDEDEDGGDDNGDNGGDDGGDDDGDDTDDGNNGNGNGGGNGNGNG